MSPVRERARTIRSKRKLIGSAAIALGAVATLLILGYLFILRHLDPVAARAAAARALEEGGLRPGERVQTTVPFSQRHWWNYFRSNHGLLTATDQRLILLTVAPPVRSSSASGQLVVEQRSYAKDTTVAVRPGRAMLGLASGVVIETPNGIERARVPEDAWPRVVALAANIEERHALQRWIARGAADARARIAAQAREPITYVVRRGDALSTIAAIYNTTPERLREWNGITGNRIRIGDTLIVKPRG